MVYQWVKSVRRWLLPPVCSLCDADGEGMLDLCTACRDELPYNTCACQRCAVPLTDPTAHLCGQCLERHWYFERTVAPFLYQPPVSSLITALKFRGRLAPARLLGALAADFIEQQQIHLPEALIPVPLHPSRLRHRGYNQALEIARILGGRLRIPVEKTACIRRRPTAAQLGLSAGERRRNLRRAFAWRGATPWSHVAVVDDVMTTGHTANEICRVLRAAGIERVEVWCVARTPALR
jgi:ComF family protein